MEIELRDPRELEGTLLPAMRFKATTAITTTIPKLHSTSTEIITHSYHQNNDNDNTMTMASSSTAIPIKYFTYREYDDNHSNSDNDNDDDNYVTTQLSILPSYDSEDPSPSVRASDTAHRTRYGTDRGRIAASEEVDKVHAANRKSVCHGFQSAQRIVAAKEFAAERTRSITSVVENRLENASFQVDREKQRIAVAREVAKERVRQERVIFLAHGGGWRWLGWGARRRRLGQETKIDTN